MIKALFFGTPEFSKQFLTDLLVDEDFLIQAVITQPDKPVGRKKILTASEVKLEAQKHDIQVLQPESLKNSEVLETLAAFNADVFIIVAYGMIIPKELLQLPKYGNINVHPSKLPQYRGPSPIQAAILNQETETAVSIMLIDEKMDHGPILAQLPLSIDPQDTSVTLLQKAAKIGSPLLRDTVKKHVNGTITPQEQDHSKATFCKMIKKEDGKINWNTSAEHIAAQLKALQPWPGIFTTLDGKNLKILELSITSEKLQPGSIQTQDQRLLVGTESTAIEIHKLQLEGKTPTDAKSFLNGYSDLKEKTLL